MSSKSRNRTSSSLRRSRSPRRKKSLSPGPLRRRPIQGKRPPSCSNQDDERHLPKRPRASPRRKPSPRLLPRGRRRSYSPNRDGPLDESELRSSQKFIVRDGASNRMCSVDKYLVDRPLFRGPDKDILMDRDSLKKIVVKMRDTPTRNDNIKRDIVNPEEINVVRRAGEGSRPIFDRDEIVNYGRKFDEGERDRKRVISRSPGNSGPTVGSSERFRARDPYYEERNANTRSYSRGRPVREYESHEYDRSRDERSRYPPSRRRSRSRDREREGHRSFRRSPERARSGERLRRRPSPRRRPDDYRPDQRERRDLDHAHYLEAEEYSDYAQEAHGHYETEMRENPVMSPSRGRGHAFSLRRRGISATRAFPRPGEIIMHPAPPVRPIRGAFLPRVPGRRLPFPPRLVRPLVGPVIRVIAPVIPVRPPVLPVRPPPIIPVRHPVIPLPF